MKNITGQKFGRLTAVKFNHSKVGKNNAHQYWFFKCDCGNYHITRKDAVLSGACKSCGCLCKEVASKTQASKLKTHGMTLTKFYRTWRGINTRCSNPNEYSYKHYGGRGIKCLWKSFEEFKDDMYESYKLHVKKFGERQTTIDRIDNDGHYCKENCKWATRHEQLNNTTRNIFYTFQGKTLTLKQWSRVLNIKYTTLYQRIKVYGWSIKRAFTI